MSDIVDNITILIGYLAALLFVGWVFYLTRNPLTFLLLLILPFLRHSKESEDKADE